MIQDYGFRLYNPAIGKFLSVDPLSPDFPNLTPYQFASNSPIEGIDLDGLEHQSTKITGWYKDGKPAVTTTTTTDIIIFQDAHVQGLTDNLVPKVAIVNPFTIVTNEYTNYQNQKFNEQQSKEFLLGLYQVQARQSNIFGNLYDISPLADGAAVYNQAKVGNYGYATGLFLAAWLPGKIDNLIAKKGAGFLSEGMPSWRIHSLLKTYNYTGYTLNVGKNRPPEELIRDLSQRYDKEVALIYTLGPGTKGRGGNYSIIIGTKDKVKIPINSETILIAHTHPQGTRAASPDDKALMQKLEDANSPQRVSTIYPRGKNKIDFDKEKTHRYDKHDKR